MMKKFVVLFLFMSGFAFSQMPNIEQVWMNKSQPYTGVIGNGKQEIKVKVNISEQNKKNDQEYFLSGYSVVENTNTKFEGKLKITKYKNGKKRSSIFGEYEFAEEPNGKHSGILKGKFVYTFMWNAKTQKIEKQYLQFIGDWASYDGALNFKTNWKN